MSMPIRTAAGKLPLTAPAQSWLESWPEPAPVQDWRQRAEEITRQDNRALVTRNDLEAAFVQAGGLLGA